MLQHKNINLVEDLDKIIESKSKMTTSGGGGDGGNKQPMPGTDATSSSAGKNFANMSMDMHTPKSKKSANEQQTMSAFLGLLWLWWWYYKNKPAKNPNGPSPMQQESFLNEESGYDNPYAIRLPQQGEKPDEEEDMFLWDALTGRIRKFGVDYGDAKPQDQQTPLKSSREQNRDMAVGYSIAAANQRISQPSGGSDPRGFETPLTWRTPVGAGKDELVHNQAYNELMKRTQDNQQDPTQMQGAWQGHPAVNTFLDQVERLKAIEAANNTDAQGGAPQQKMGGGGNPMAAMMGGAGGGENPMAAMQKMMGGKKEEDDDEEGSGGDQNPMAMIQKMMGGQGGDKEEDEEKIYDKNNEELPKTGFRRTSPIATPPSQMDTILNKKKKKKKDNDPLELLQAIIGKLF